MEDHNCKDEIIRYVLNSSELDHLMIATFIAGMQAKKNTWGTLQEDEKSTHNEEPRKRFK